VSLGSCFPNFRFECAKTGSILAETGSIRACVYFPAVRRGQPERQPPSPAQTEHAVFLLPKNRVLCRNRTQFAKKRRVLRTHNLVSLKPATFVLRNIDIALGIYRGANGIKELAWEEKPDAAADG
jgi:hypothetical protein